MGITVRDIAHAIEDWAPVQTAQSYDNVGLQIGRIDAAVGTILIALDVTPDVIEEAVEHNVDLLITHHPLLFRPLRTITSGGFVSGQALRLAEHGVALYAAHTNLDAAENGVSFALAAQLELENVRFLSPMDGHVLKVVTFVPSSHADVVREALGQAGAGVIGKYDACAFTSQGIGYFRPSEDANPFVGEATGEVQSSPEVRIEVEVADWRLATVVAALNASHPYEEVAYDVYEVRQPFRSIGMGAVGELSSPLSEEDFLEHVADKLESPGIRYSGSANGPVRRVAVCGGSGSDLLADARRVHVDAFVTADVTYHRYFDVFDDTGSSSLLLVDAGHYETERATERLLVEFLQDRFPAVSVRNTRHRTGPMRYYTRR